jgi:hypothetical protein
METKPMLVTRVLVVLTVSSASCSPADDADMGAEHDDVDAEQKAHDRQVCLDAAAELVETGCPLGYLPRVQYGIPAASTDIEAVGSPICGGVGYFVDGDDIEEWEWVGVDIVQNSFCTVGCFAPYCQGHANGCFAGRVSGGLCLFSCGDDTDEESCLEAVMLCNEIDPETVDPEDEACGLEPSGG